MEAVVGAVANHPLQPQRQSVVASPDIAVLALPSDNVDVIFMNGEHSSALLALVTRAAAHADP